MSQCLEEQLLAAYVSGSLPLEEARAIRAHLDACPECRLVVDVVGATRDKRPEEAWTLRPGEIVGPYEVLEWLGRGGMGSVFAANDPRLRRRVALKIQDAHALEDGDRPLALERLRREAQAMARLNHPNVAAVYDVGERNGLPYLAMELLPGGTLRGWLLAERRSVREILRVFVAAARGLQHAHDAGLVHRDFKTDNVLMAADGTPRLTDFGLAAVDGVGEGDAGSLGASARVAGTPAYLAPELLLGHRATPASDQYSFGVALRDALLNARMDDARTGTRLDRTVARLTASAPGERFPSMSAAAEALEAALPPRKSWARTALFGAGVTAATLLVFALWPRPPACDAAGAPARTLISDLEAEVPSALRGLDGPAEGALSAAVLRELRGQLARWTTLAETTCRSQAVDAQALSVREATTRCLEEQLEETRSFATGLSRQPPEDGTAVVVRLLALPPPEVCAGLSAEDALAYADASQAEQRRAHRETLHALLHRIEATRAPELIGEVDALLGSISEQHEPLLYARVLALKVELEWTDPYHCATPTLHQLGQVARVALAGHHKGLAALTWNELSRCHRARGELQQGFFAANYAGELTQALPEDAFLRHHSELERVRRLIPVGRRAEAAEHFKAARDEIVRRFGERHPLYALALRRDGDLRVSTGDLQGGLAVYPRAMDALERALGKHSPEWNAAAHNHAWALAQTFHFEEALAIFEALAKESLARTGEIRRAISSDLVPVLVALGRRDEALFHGRASLSGVSPRELRVLASMGQEVNAWAEAELAFGDAAAVVERLAALRELEGLADGGAVDDVDRRVLEARALLALKRPKDALALLDDASTRFSKKTFAKPRTAQGLAYARVLALVAVERAAEAETLLTELPLNTDGPGLDPLRRAEAWVEVALVHRRAGARERASALSSKVTPLLAELGARATALQQRAAPLPLVPGGAKAKSRAADATISGGSVW